MSNESNEMASIVVIGGVREEKVVYETNLGVDESGAPIVEFQVQNGFDGMTGEPVYVTVVKDGFDPETGKPVYVEKTAAPAVEEVPAAEVVPVAEEVPAAEETPVVDETVQSPYSDATVAEVTAAEATAAEEVPAATVENAQAKAADSTMYNQTADTKKKNTGILIAIVAIVAALVVIGIVACAAIKGGLFMSPRNRIALAAANTAKESSLVEAVMDASALASADELTATISGGVSSYDVNADLEMTLAQNIKDGKYYSEGSVDIAGITEQSFKLYYDDKKFQFMAPDITDTLFEYNYTAKNDGYLAELLEDETDGSIEDLNTVFAAISELGQKSNKYRKELASEVSKAYSKVEVEKLGSEKFEIDGKDRKCKGYSITITEDDLKNFVEAYQKATESAYGDSMRDLFDALSNLSGEDMDYDDIMDEMSDEIDDFDDITFDVFIYKNKLAAIETKIDGSKLAIEFHGGDKRISEIMIKADGEKVYIKDKDRNGKETITLEASGSDLGSVSYNKENGKFILAAGREEFEGVFKVDAGKKIELGFDGSYSGVSMDIKSEIVKGAKIKQLKGDVFDLGTADEDDYEDLIEDLSSEIYSIMGMGSSYDYDDYYDDDESNPFDL